MAEADPARSAATDPMIGEVVVGRDELTQRVAELGSEIAADFRGREPLLVGVLKGAFVFMSDLARAIDLPLEVDFITLSSYGGSTRSGGVVRPLSVDIEVAGRDVIIVEDIIDSGLTLSYLHKNLGGRNPSSLSVCALLVKPPSRPRDHLPPLRYVGFEIPAEFVIGYGLDVAEKYRNLPYVARYAGPDRP